MLHPHSITEYFIGYKVLHQGKRQIKRQIKDKLKDRGITTRLGSIKKIQEVFLYTLRDIVSRVPSTNYAQGGEKYQ